MWPLFILLGLTVSNSTSKVKERTTKARPNPHPRQWVWVALGLLVVGSAVTWRPLVAVTYANLGAVKQAKAKLATGLPQDTKDAHLQAATASYKRALNLAPSNRTANLRLGNLAAADGRYKEALAHLEIAWRTAPEDPTARKALGLACTWVGEIDRAAELLKDTREIVSELNTWAWWHGQEGRQQVSMNAYQTSLALKPDQPQVRDRLSALESQ
jgi:tetratricopeptide (TPR) repeat protein